MLLDYDLSSIQEARNLAQKARDAQKAFAEFSQEEVDKIVASMAEAGESNAEWLARMAVDETKFGVFEDKITKNIFASRHVHEYIREMKTVGVISEDKVRKVVEIAAPVGVVMGIVPSTNPTSTVIYKCLISLKSRNAIVISPHPSASRCTYAAAQLMHEAAVKAGAPEGIIGCLGKITMQATDALMKSDNIDVILATGGSAMVKAAYSSGKPAFGVGPGNVPAFIERSADIEHAVSCIMASKTFDNGTICASEQAIVVEEAVRDRVIEELKKQGAYFMSPEETEKVARCIFTPRGMNPLFVGRSAAVVSEKCGIKAPPGTRVLIGEQAGVGKNYPLSHEKLTTVLGFYVEKDWHAACQRCIQLLDEEGIGHSLVIHSRDEEIIKEFALKKPVFRILVNTPSALGGIGYSTGLAPALTLGCGTWGGSSTSDNVTPLHLINIKRLAYGIREYAGSSRNPGQGRTSTVEGTVFAGEIESIVLQVLNRLKETKPACGS
ncbi:MAG: acetaldehyde dehydrogenase (acetylating) [Bacillota bacterium]